MPENGNIDKHFEFLKQAFANDGFDVKYFDNPQKPGEKIGYLEYQGKIGMLGLSRTAKNIVTGEPKRVYYIEGDAYQMGYLLGMMAEPEVERMATEFVENIIFDFFNVEEINKQKDSGIMDLIKNLVVEILYNVSKKMQPDIPNDYIRELSGIYNGCLAVNQKSKVQWDKLWALNFGVDCLLAHVYTGKIFAEQKIAAHFLRVPIHCNAYSLIGPSVADGRHYFGRDFMFPTANVFQDTACLIIYNPVDPGGQKRLPIVSQTAPGFVGSVAAMNNAGAAIGVDMAPSMLCDPGRPGFNSLALIRDCMHHCATTDETVKYVTEAQRGVSWFYPVADGGTGKACIIEAGLKIDDNSFPYFDYIPDHYKKHLPNIDFIQQMQQKYKTPPPQKGLIPRWHDYPYAVEYLNYNQGLVEAFNWDLEMRLLFPKVKYDPNVWGETGFVDPTWDDKNCPGPFYFAPQRETTGDLVLVSNHAITPEMRLTAMNHWVALISAGDLNDIQWRYDALNYQVLTMLEAITKGQRGKIGESDAWKLITFLSPVPGSYYPAYYNRKNNPDWQHIQVEGSVSLFELTGKKATSLFGYYGDQPISIQLLNYLDPGQTGV